MLGSSLRIENVSFYGGKRPNGSERDRGLVVLEESEFLERPNTTASSRFYFKGVTG